MNPETIPYKTLAEIARRSPQARIGAVLDRLRAKANADAMRAALPIPAAKPRYRVKAGSSRSNVVPLRARMNGLLEG